MIIAWHQITFNKKKPQIDNFVEDFQVNFENVLKNKNLNNKNKK